MQSICGRYHPQRHDQQSTVTGYVGVMAAGGIDVAHITNNLGKVRRLGAQDPMSVMLGSLVAKLVEVEPQDKRTAHLQQLLFDATRQAFATQEEIDDLGLGRPSDLALFQNRVRLPSGPVCSGPSQRRLTPIAQSRRQDDGVASLKLNSEPYPISAERAPTSSS